MPLSRIALVEIQPKSFKHFLINACCWEHGKVPILCYIRRRSLFLLSVLSAVSQNLIRDWGIHCVRIYSAYF